MELYFGIGLTVIGFILIVVAGGLKSDVDFSWKLYNVLTRKLGADKTVTAMPSITWAIFVYFLYYGGFLLSFIAGMILGNYFNF